MARVLWLCAILLAYLLDKERVDALINATSATKYLEKFGYLKTPDSMSGASLTDDEISKGIRLFQNFIGLPETGTLDLTTLKKMEEPRCGYPDIFDKEKSQDMEKYVLMGSKWHKKKLTYSLNSVARALTKKETEDEVARGFQAWQRISDLWIKSTPSDESADIEVKFVSGDHGDGYPFDGVGGVLAHAWGPINDGPIHFDNDETWLLENGDGFILRTVAIHEMGHSLGIHHSMVPDAIMYPYYSPDNTGLHQDDIDAIQALYGRNVGPTPFRSRPDRCDPKFDAVTIMKDGRVYAFSGNFFWKLNQQGIEENSMQKIESVWGIRGIVDASLSHGEFTDLFHGKHVRRYINDKLVDGYPKLISEQYPGMPSHIDAAWIRNGFIYFLKGMEYWVFNSATKQSYTGYPRPISLWEGLPKSVDAAVQWDGFTYFFRDGEYWRFNDKKQPVFSNDPQTTNKWWPGCSESSAMLSASETTTNGARSTSEISFHVATSLILFGFTIAY